MSDDAVSSTLTEAEAVARAYLEAFTAHDVEAAVAHWASGGRQHVRGQIDATAPDGLRAHMSGVLASVPDVRFEVVRAVTEADRCAIQWRMTGTFDGTGALQGVAPTGHAIVLEGIDLFTVRHGLIQQNDAFSDTMEFTRQIGMMPPQRSRAERVLTGLFNVKTRLLARRRR